MRQLPGLRRLWSPYHVATPAGVATAPTLLARLARALFDPSLCRRRQFCRQGPRDVRGARLPRLDDPAISREIGMLLGNDLGQMRDAVQRQDLCRRAGLSRRRSGPVGFRRGRAARRPRPSIWRLTRRGSSSAKIRTRHRSDPDVREDDSRSAARARSRRTSAACVIAKYPEWDRRARHRARRSGPTVREVAARPGDPRLVEEALDRADVLAQAGFGGWSAACGSAGRSGSTGSSMATISISTPCSMPASRCGCGSEPDPRIFRTTDLEASRSCGAAAARHLGIDARPSGIRRLHPRRRTARGCGAGRSHGARWAIPSACSPLPRTGATTSR